MILTNVSQKEALVICQERLKVEKDKYRIWCLRQSIASLNLQIKYALLNSDLIFDSEYRFLSNG